MTTTHVLCELRASVWRISVANGDLVEAEQELMTLECMKTEIPVPSPRAGRVKEILVAEGTIVSERQPLLILEG